MHLSSELRDFASDPVVLGKKDVSQPEPGFSILQMA
jgi:hypothetical protein